MKSDLKSLKSTKPGLNALKSGQKPSEHYIFLNPGIPEVRPEILKIPEILKSGLQAPKTFGPSTLSVLFLEPNTRKNDCNNFRFTNFYSMKKTLVIAWDASIEHLS